MLVIVPSRGRPENIARLRDAFDETTCASTDLLVAVDDDDPKLDQYQKLRNVWLHVGPRLRIGPTINNLAMSYYRYYDVVGFMGDDHLPRTGGWDYRILQALHERSPGVAYGNDLVHGEAIPTAAFLTSDIIGTLGYFVPHGMIHLFFDNYWKTLGEALGSIHYLPNVIIEHLHPIAGRAEWDETYREANASEVWDADEKRYHEYVANELDDAVAKLR